MRRKTLVVRWLWCLGLMVCPLAGCKLPIDAAYEKAGLVNSDIGKKLRPKNDKVGFGTGIDARAKEIEENLGYR